jgi:hypothetical protein
MVALMVALLAMIFLIILTTAQEEEPVEVDDLTLLKERKMGKYMPILLVPEEWRVMILQVILLLLIINKLEY